MANKKITELSTLTGVAANDVLPIVDTSAAATKGVTVSELFTSPSLTTPNLGAATGTSLAVGTGDNQTCFVTTTAQVVDIRKGTSAAPDTTSDPLVKVSRTLETTTGTYSGADGREELYALGGVCVGTASCDGQPVGIFGGAKTSSTQSSGNDDACAVLGLGIANTGGTGLGIGAYLEGRSDSSASGSGTTGVEVRSTNNTGSDTTYTGSAYTGTVGAWFTCGSSTVGRVHGAAIQTGTVSSNQWDVGIGFATIGGISSIKTTCIRDDSSAAQSIRINGTHASGAIQVSSGSGHVGLGVAPVSSVELFVKADGDAVAGMIIRGNSVSQSSGLLLCQNHDGTTTYLTVGAAGATTVNASLKSTSATGGLGYGTGAGGSVTQASSRTTGVTLNTVCGAITLVSAAGSTTYQTFTVTNSAVAATDTVRVCQQSGTDLYEIHVTNVVSGSFKITYRTTGGTTTEQPVFNFAVFKGATS